MSFDPVNIAGLVHGPSFVPNPYAPQLIVLADPPSPAPSWDGYPSWFPCNGIYVDARGNDYTTPKMCAQATSSEETASFAISTWVTGPTGSPVTLADYTPAPDYVLVSIGATAYGSHASPGCFLGEHGGGVDATRGCLPVPPWNPTHTLSCAGHTFTGHGSEHVGGVVPNPTPVYTGDPTNDAEDCLFPYADALSLEVVWDIISGDGFHRLDTTGTENWIVRTFYGGSYSSSSLMAVL